MSRSEVIHAKGFNMSDNSDKYYSEAVPTEYKRIKVGVKNLDDAVLNLGSIKASLPGHGYTQKATILRALADHDLTELRNISNFYYNMNGIYQRVCNYFAFLYRYDWYVVPEIYGSDEVKEEKVLKDFAKVLNYLDNSNIRKICGDIALSVIKDGAYYGYIVPSNEALVLQQLPIGFCRTRYTVRGLPAVEFNMKFFDTFRDPGYRMKVLKLFPDEFAKGYMLYKQNKLVPDFPGDNSGAWYLLEPENCVKFNFNNSDVPMFVNAIPALLDLDAAQDLDRRKQMQKLLKIIIQKLPMDKNGDLIFDIDEARDIHNNAVEMLRRAVGVDVLTTFADIDSVDMSDKNTSTTTDDLEKVERAVFNSLGISQNLFNTDGNMSLEKSILNDESSVRNLLLQFSIFFDRVTRARCTNSKKYFFKLYMLETTQYNYRELAKLYKEQTQLGYSKMLPQIALGHSQSFILNTAHFENEILHLQEIMIPPLMSSTMSSEDVLGKKEKSTTNKNQNTTTTSTGTEKASGRPEKPDDQKSDKTIQNKESMS
jgi:hypothetical protein